MSVRKLRRWRWSLFAFSFIVGIAMASWVTRTPAVRDAVDASTAQMGLILFGVSVGSVVGVLPSARLIGRIGTRPIIQLGSTLVILGIAVVGVAAALGPALGVFIGFLIFGLGSGLGEVALNVDGAELERRLGRSVLPALHGSFSLGTVVGAVLGIVFTAVDLPVLGHLGGCAIALAALALWARRGLQSGIGMAAPAASDPDAAAPRGARSVWRDPTLVLLGVMLLALALSEGAAGDWMPLIMVDGVGLSQTLGSVFYASFAAVMAVGRFGGDALIARFGKQGVLLGSMIIAATGIALVALVDLPVMVIAGVVLWGMGSALGFPVAISLAGDSDDRPGDRVGAVTTVGYLAFLVGPPGLGFLGEQHGLRAAILLVVALLVVGMLAGVLRTRMRRRGAPAASKPEDASAAAPDAALHG